MKQLTYVLIGALASLSIIYSLTLSYLRKAIKDTRAYGEDNRAYCEFLEEQVKALETKIHNLTHNINEDYDPDR